MRTILKWLGRILGGLVGLVVVAIIVVFVLSTSKINKTYDVTVETVAIPDDEAALERGEHLATAVAVCAACHTESLGGQAFIEDPALAVLYASNLTAGAGGVGAEYSDEDWVRTIRYGVDPSGKSVVFMPSQHFYYLSDEDLGALIAYLKSVPPVDNELPEVSVGPMGRLFMLLEPSLLPASLVDHGGPRPSAPSPGVTEAYGEYLVRAGTCMDCHGAELNGAPPIDPENPPGANLTPGGELAGWSEADFIQTMRTGVNPAGRELQGTMAEAIEFYGQQSDEELAAIFAYLQSLPARETGY